MAEKKKLTEVSSSSSGDNGLDFINKEAKFKSFGNVCIRLVIF